MIIFLKRPAFHSEHFHFSEHEKRKDQNNLKPHYKIAPKGAWLPYQICEIIKKVVIREARKGSVGNLLAFCVNGVWKAVTFVFEQLNIL
ncbi:MAG TPA: hypothetical protein DIT80_13055 [Lachnospiraceae bacterium]|jgi:hypothetical protein|nr:hypothetical protein [Lachnospiraceae bacterium]